MCDSPVLNPHAGFERSRALWTAPKVCHGQQLEFTRDVTVSSSMLRLPALSRSLIPAALTKGGAAPATNNGNNTPLHQQLHWPHDMCVVPAEQPFCLSFVYHN